MAVPFPSLTSTTTLCFDLSFVPTSPLARAGSMRERRLCRLLGGVPHAYRDCMPDRVVGALSGPLMRPKCNLMSSRQRLPRGHTGALPRRDVQGV